MNTLNALFDWVLGSGLRASLLVLAVLAAHWLLRNRLPSRWRYALWLPVLVALLVPALPLLPAWMNWPAVRAEISEKTTLPAPASPALTADATLPPFAERAEVPAMPPGTLEATSTIKTAAAQALRATAPAATPVNWRAWLMAAWFIGAAGVSLFVVVSFALTMRRIRRAALPVKAESLAHVAATAQVVGLRRVPCILKSSAVASPAVCGLWRPTLLLNERFPQDLSADEADMVLRHELTHIRRGDLALNALLCALLALHWWNPLLWLAFFRVRADREAACDAQVLDGEPAARRAAYGHTLLKMETEFPPTGLCLGFVGILQRGGTLRERIHAIISQPQLNQAMKITIALSIVALTIVGIAKAAEDKPAKEETEATPREEKEFKGVNLYARFDEAKNQWLFGLLPGTNREKEVFEVNQAMTLKGIDALLAEMKRLAPQEEVFLVSPAPDGIKVTPLDEETQKKLVEFCAKHQIILTGEGKWLQQPNRTIAALEGSSTKRELILSQTEIDGKGLAMIAEKFPALEALELSFCGITDGDFSPLGKLKSLKTLSMNDNYDMTGKSFGFVAELKNLRRLNLEQCAALTDEAVAAISKSTTLESLNLGYCKSLTAACAPYLGAMTSLKELNLANVGLPDSAMKDLVKIKGLTSLDIAVSKVTDEGLAAIATMPNLKRLGLRACRSVTFTGIKSLAPLRLENLDINVAGSGKPPLDEDAVIEFAKKTWPGCEVVNSKTATAHLAGLVEHATTKTAAPPNPEPKAEKVTVAEFKKQYEMSKMIHSAHDITYLGQKDGKAFIRVRSAIHASSLFSRKQSWSERVIYVQLQDLDAEFRQTLPVEAKKDQPKGASAGAKANAMSVLKDGEYTLKATRRTSGSQVQSPNSPIPDAAYKPFYGVKVSIPLQFTENGRKVSINVGKGVAGTLEEQTGTERIYSLTEGLFAGGQLRLKQTADGIIGTYTLYGSGLPVVSSIRGVVTPAEAAEAATAPAKDGNNGAKGQPLDLEKIKDKVSVKFGEDTVANLRRDGDRLLPRAPGEKGDANDVAVKITIKETTATPVPVQGDPTRSYLSISNGFDKPLHFRALSRRKGSKEFYEVKSPLGPVEPGDITVVKCWESGTLLEEVILYQFTLTPEAPDTVGKAEATPTVDGAQAERVATITKQLSKAGKLPGPLLDAQFVEEQTGDGVLGPSDFAAFYALTVAPADLPAWRAALSNPKATWNRFANDSEIKRAAPKKAQPWWVKQSDLGALEFYSPKSLTGRANGWIGIAPDGRIFIYAFTM